VIIYKLRKDNDMKISKSIRALSIATLFAIPLTAALASTARAQTDAQKAFATIKSMPGTWEGKSEDGSPLQVNFKVTAGGSAVESEILGKEDMISMIHLDGPNKLLLTHYCAMGNQPRMQASVSPDARTITFSFVDATNLATPEDGHMQRMVLTLLDDNHHTEEWIFAGQGKEVKRVFDLHRKL
jgi:hypothetical protein